MSQPISNRIVLSCISACMLLAIMAATAIAQPSSPAAPIELAADSAEVNDITGISTYRGNVILTRGNLEITGDTMTVNTNDERQLERIVVEGNPATYRETLPGTSPRRAQAPRMEYFASGPERIILLQGGRLWQGENAVVGETITHYPGEQRTIAESAPSSSERVNVTVYPEDNNAQ